MKCEDKKIIQTLNEQLFDGDISLKHWKETIKTEVTIPPTSKPITQFNTNEDLIELIGGYDWLTDEEKEILE